MSIVSIDTVALPWARSCAPAGLEFASCNGLGVLYRSISRFSRLILHAGAKFYMIRSAMIFWAVSVAIFSLRI